MELIDFNNLIKSYSIEYDILAALSKEGLTRGIILKFVID